MQRPDIIWIGPFPYTITYDTAAINAVSVKQEKALLGHSNHRDLVLTIDDGGAEQVVRDTLLHETLHAIWVTSGLVEMPDPTQEQIIASITPQLVYMLRANPELVEYLTRTGDTR